jgi:hypothetical protein
VNERLLQQNSLMQNPIPKRTQTRYSKQKKGPSFEEGPICLGSLVV